MIRRLVLAGTALMSIAAGPAPIPAGPIPTGPIQTGKVALLSQPGSALDRTAREVAGADIADAGGRTLLLLGSQRLGAAGTGPALFVQVQSDRSCGSAGCSTSVYLPVGRGWKKVFDGVGTMVVDAQQHRGMHDLLIGDDRDRWQWNGANYADTVSAPQVDLRPRKRPTRTPSRARP